MLLRRRRDFLLVELSPAERALAQSPCRDSRSARCYGALALALVLVYRATHVINFAQGELAMLTTYIAYQLMQWGSHTGGFAATLAIAFVLGTCCRSLSSGRCSTR